MGCCDACCNALREGTLRLINLGLFGLGLCTLGYGLIVLLENDFSTVVLSLLGIGFFLSLLTGALAFMCHRNRSFLFVYMVVMTLLCLATIIAGVAFIVPDWRDKALSHFDDKSQADKLRDYTKIASYAFFGLAAGMMIALFLAQRQRRHLRNLRDLDQPLTSRRDRDDLELGKSSSSSSHGKTPKTDALREQMHSRYAHLYEEYGIPKGGSSSQTRMR